MVILVTGGAGYIGSHTAALLKKQGFRVVIYDNFSSGHSEAVKDYPVVIGDIADENRISETIKLFKVEAVMHFAASSLVGESMVDPAKYFYNNVSKGVAFFNQLLKNQIKYVIFSSSAALYGEPAVTPISEDHIINPTNTYGETKYMLEKILQRYHQAYGLKYVSLRYFNAAGADPGGAIGEDHRPETHLIPIVLQAALGQREKVTVFGDDYQTRDGTAVRDYIHVNDLATAHILALKALTSEMPWGIYNLGNQQGFTVLEVLEAAKKITKKDIKIEIGPRRQGDPSVLVASSEKIRRELGWQPQYSDLEQIIASAWNWHHNHPNGFSGESLK